MKENSLSPTVNEQSIPQQSYIVPKHSIKAQQDQKKAPLLIKVIDFLGLRNFFIDRFIFSRKPSNYKLKKFQNSPVFDFISTKFNQIPGYRQQCAIIDTQNNFIPVVHFKLHQNIQSGRNSQINKTDCSSPLKVQSKTSLQNLTIIYSHGNCSNIEGSYSFATAMTQVYKCNFIVYDYTGYANQAGNSKHFDKQKHILSQKSLFEDLKAVIEWSQVPKQNIVLWGFSLGCFSTLSVAAQLQVAGVILQSPFASIYRFISDEINHLENFENDIFNNIGLIDKIRSNMLIVHSIDDQITPIWHSQQLMRRFQAKGKPKYLKMLELKNFSHNNLDQAFYAKKTNKLQEYLHDYLKVCCKNSQISNNLLEALQNPERGKQCNQQKSTKSKDQQLTEDISIIPISKQDLKNKESLVSASRTKRNKKRLSLSISFIVEESNIAQEQECIFSKRQTESTIQTTKSIELPPTENHQQLPNHLSLKIS